MQKNLSIINEKGKLQIGKNALIMGIVNITPDSFSNDGFYNDINGVLRHAVKLVNDGANIIDVGGESTRPEATQITEEEEIKRVIPVIQELSQLINIPISIDTYKAKVAAKALDAGAQIINDVSALSADMDMVNVAAANNVPIVLMHMKGNPHTMQKSPDYNDVITEIITFFQETIRNAVRCGIDKNNIIIDPGIGFGKKIHHNLEILNRLRDFKTIGNPVMVGSSRKSFIGKITNKPADQRLLGSLATVAIAVTHGANIVRVHDVKETAEIVKICNAVLNS